MTTTSKKGIWTIDDTYKKIEAGYWEYVGLVTGQLWAWGRNNAGQLGNSTLVHQSSPVQIPGTQWSKLSAGSNGSVFAIKTDTTLWAWGCNDQQMLGISGIVHQSSPVQVSGSGWTSISAGQQHTLARKSTSLYGWGVNVDGRLAQSQYIPNSGYQPRPNCVGSACTIDGSWADVSAGHDHSIGIKTDGTLWGWGRGDDGQLGTGPFNIPYRAFGVRQVQGTQWSKVEAGDKRSFALKTDGTLWGWGCNCSGQLGVNDKTHRSSPTQIPGNTWNDITTAYRVAFARKTDGTLWGWGSGGNVPVGQLGHNLQSGTSSPIQIPGNTWSDICGVDVLNVLARKTDGTLWGWGCNFAGVLGQNDSTVRSSPVQIPGTQWCAIASGFSSLAIKCVIL